jgi:hypothetical protein
LYCSDCRRRSYASTLPVLGKSVTQGKSVVILVYMLSSL